MTPDWFGIALEFAVIGCGLIAGFFLTFSDFLMRSLGLAKGGAGIEVMQIINREVFRSLIMVLLWGMLALSTALAGYAALLLEGPAASLVMGGFAFYFLGVLVVTFAFNVPMNVRLEEIECTSTEAQIYWRNTYLPRWTAWNYARAVASAGASTCFLLARVSLTH